MRNESTRVVYELIQKDRNVLAVTADQKNEIYERIRQENPTQYIDYGISECNMVASCAGLAAIGKIPFLYTVTNFMAMRAFEFIRDSVCVPKANVKFLGRSTGLVCGALGMTHAGTEDMAILRSLPNLLVVTPATPLEARQAAEYAYKHQGPVYIRLEGYNEPEHYVEAPSFKPGCGHCLLKGNDLSIITMGSIVNEALMAADILRQEYGIAAEILSLSTLRPTDEALICATATKTGLVMTVEEHTVYGGLGSTVAEVLAEQGVAAKLKRMGFMEFSHGCGNREEMRQQNGFTAMDIVREARSFREAQ
ncbi:MAG: transketolase [Selenomonas ruminantium]|nr:transketolase [Selenomonas ruminantium]